jgi:fatty-acyl-CoA synthase
MGVEVRIVSLDTTAQALPWDGNAVGELQTKGPWVAAAYLDDEDDAHGLRTEDGWLRTGDLARIDSRGHIFIVDRTKDLIKSGGEWISSTELEEAIRSHPQVAEVAVIGVPDERWQERPIAFVISLGGAVLSVEDMRTFLSRDLPLWWAPDRVETLEALPRTSVGKIDKQALRARCGA